MYPLKTILLLASSIVVMQVEPVLAFTHPMVPSHGSRTVHMSVHQDHEHGRRAFITQFMQSACLGGAVLGSSLTKASANTYQQEYLKEPTAEFKAMEAKQAEFAKAQRQYKADFVKVLNVST
ncbi:unnamed protein product [Choristocarpus tenellus]